MKKLILLVLIFGFSMAVNAKEYEGWGGELNGLRMRLTAPEGTVYSRGKSLPLVIEVQNVSDQPIPLNKLSSRLTYKITDDNDNLIGVYNILYDHLTPWENADGVLQSREIIKDYCFLERLRLGRFKAPSSFKLYFMLPTQKIIPGKLPIEEYSNPLTIKIKDYPFEQTLKSAGLPDKWTTDLDIVYRYGRTIWFGDITIHIDGSGRVTTSADPRNSRRPALNGRHQIMMEPNELNTLIKQLKEFKIERLKRDVNAPPPIDTPMICFSISKGEQAYREEYVLQGEKTDPVFALYKIMEGFLDKVTEKINSRVQYEIKTNGFRIDNISLSATSGFRSDDINLEGTKNLIWGNEVNGLQAAVELIPHKESYSLGENIKVRFYIQNVGNKTISISTMFGKTNYIQCILEDKQGEVITGSGISYSGRSNIGSRLLRPGETEIKDGGTLRIAKDTEETEIFTFPFGYKAILKPGQYKLYYELRFPTLISRGFLGQFELSSRNDWKGKLITGKLNFIVTDKIQDASTKSEHNAK